MTPSFDTYHLSVSAALVLSTLPFRASNDVRYYLNGVCVQKEPNGGALVMATDGSALVVFHDEDGVAPLETILPISKREAVYLRKGGHVRANSDGLVWITDADGRAIWISPEAPIDGKFPNFRPLFSYVSKYTDGLVGNFNPSLLERVRQAAPKRPRGIPVDVSFFHNPERPNNSAALATIGDNGIALIMPMYRSTPLRSLVERLPASLRSTATPVAEVA